MTIIGLDLDDTIYDRDVVYQNVYKEMQNSHVELPISFSEFNNVFQEESILEYEKFSAGEKGREDYKLDRVSNTYNYFGYNVTKKETEIFNQLYEHYRNKITIRPGMLKLLKYLKEKNSKMFVLTNGPSGDQRNKFDTLELYKYISDDKLFISDEMGYSKPQPEIFELIEQHFNVEPSNYIYIGDNIDKDILPALKRGWKAIYYNFMNLKCEDNIINFNSDYEIYEHIKNNL